MYYILFTKILQGGDKASETVFHKRCCRTCGESKTCGQLSKTKGLQSASKNSLTEIVNLRISASNN